MRWLGWFRPLRRGSRKGKFIVSPVEVHPLKEKREKKKIIISIPRACGSAVKRNKMRRYLKSYIESESNINSETKGLWIRVQKNYRLGRKLDKTYIKEMLSDSFS